MGVLVVASAEHIKKEGRVWSYAPYVKEMNHVLANRSELSIIAPFVLRDLSDIHDYYENDTIRFIEVPTFNIRSAKHIMVSLLVLPSIVFKLFMNIRAAEKIHIRAPSNIGLLAIIICLVFPRKYKTVKYANNWDVRSSQPKSFKIQRQILNNRFLIKNISVLVYGEWSDSSNNIVPFYTASYSKKLRERTWKEREPVVFAFTGTLTENKGPFEALEIFNAFCKITSLRCQMIFHGDGPLKGSLMEYSESLGLSENCNFLGNVGQDVVIDSLKRSHFSLLISKSEGWPKAVAEAMWWGAIPIASKVSCVPQMLGFGERGILVEDYNPESVAMKALNLFDSSAFDATSLRAQLWAQEYTMENFSKDMINKIFNENSTDN